VLLSVVARATDNSLERAKSLEEGEELLARGCVSHSYLEFYTHAIEVSLEHGEWDEARRYAAALEAYTAREPLPYTNLLIRRARLLADFGEGKQAAATLSGLEEARSECMRINARAALKAVEAALTRERS